MKNTNVLLSIKNLKKYFPLKKKSIFSKEQLYVRANEDISLEIHEGETVGIVGESGCGKSTLGRTILQLYPQTAGTTMYYGRSLDYLAPKYVEDTLKHPQKYIDKYQKAKEHAEMMRKQVEEAGDSATYSQHMAANLAEDDEHKALANVAKVLGGFMTVSDMEDCTKILLKRHYLGGNIFKQNDKIKQIELKIDILETQLLQPKTKNPEKIHAKIDNLNEKLKEQKQVLAEMHSEFDNVCVDIKAMVASHTGKGEFDKYQELYDTGIDLSRLKYNEIRLLRRDIQIIFQDPYSSLNPRMTVGQIIEEGLVTHNFFKSGSEKMKEYILETMRKCGLQDYMLHRYPHQFSGGQRQRICIARALALNPKFVVCDECVSALDVSIQSQIINLLHELKEKEGLTYMFISHDLSVVKYISDRIGVMYLGNMVELATSDVTFKDPRHPYTVALLSSIPTTDVDKSGRERIILEGNIPSPIFPPSGCKFRTRCFMATEKCAIVPPKLQEVEPGHFVACHYPEKKINEKGEYLFEVKTEKIN